MTWLLMLLSIPLWLPPKPTPARVKNAIPVRADAPKPAAPTVVAAPSGPTTNPVSVTVDPVNFPSGPGYHVYKSVAHCDSRTIPLAFGVYLPRAYFESNDPLPVVVALHTRGASGADGRHRYIDEELALLTTTTRQDFRTEGEYSKVRLDLHTQGKFICLMPQAPQGMPWETPPVGRIVKAEIEMVLRAYSADADRVYVSGFSYGGSSTWQIALQIPEMFAAIAPVDARQTKHPDEDVKVLAKLPIYMAVGQNDKEFVRECNNMDAALKKVPHADYVYRTVPRGNHFCYPCVYEDQAFWDWMFAHRRTSPTTSAATALP